MSRCSIFLGFLGFLAAAPGSASDGRISIRDFMTQDEIKATGLAKLTPAEEAALTAWLADFADKVKKSVSRKTAAPAQRPQVPRVRDSYEVEVSHNDELFVINGERFEAKTYCFNMEEGDRVLFIEGSPLGVCVTATFVNLRTKDKCEVWCE